MSQRKGKPLTALVSVERLQQVRRLARRHALDVMAQQKGGALTFGRTGFNYGIALVLAATSVVGATIGMLLARRSSTHRLGRVLVGVSVALLVGDVAGWLWRAAQPSKFSAF